MIMMYVSNGSSNNK
jgi:hypothetical protein